MVTTLPGVALGIGTADCAPVLLADPAAGVIGAAHAGWRGAVNGVRRGRRAQHGSSAAPSPPACAPPSAPASPRPPTKWGRSSRSRSCSRTRERRFFVPSKRAGHFMFDLPGYVVSRLRRLGIAAAEHVAHDTCAEADMFFSYRRTTLAGEKTTAADCL